MRISLLFLSARSVIAAALLLVHGCGSDEIPLLTIPAADYYNINYGSKELNIHTAAREPNSFLPVLVFIHGGGWRNHTKDEWKFRQYEFFRGHNVVSISIDFSNTDSQGLITHPAHISDIALAINWIHHNISLYGGDNNKIFLIGHSSGAHLASLLVTNSKYINSKNIILPIIKGVILLDAGPYLSLDDLDFLESQITIDNYYKEVYSSWVKAFGSSRHEWNDALPLSNLNPLSYLPPFILLHSDHIYRVIPNQRFEHALISIEKKVKRVEIKNKGHLQFLSDIGSQEDHSVLSKSIIDFINESQSHQ